MFMFMNLVYKVSKHTSDEAFLRKAPKTANDIKRLNVIDFSASFNIFLRFVSKEVFHIKFKFFNFYNSFSFDVVSFYVVA